MQTEVCFHFLGTAKKSPEQSLELGHDCTIPHSYQFITHYPSVAYRVGQTSVVRFIKCTYVKIRCKIISSLAVQKELVKLRHRCVN